MRRIIGILALLWILGACQKETPSLNSLKGEAFGTTYSILYYGGSDEIEACLSNTIASVNQSVSTYLPDSDISRINRGETGLVVDETFVDVFELSSTVYRTSEGYFDPTVGVLRNAYGFGDTQPLTTIDSTVLDSLMNLVGLEKVKLTEDRTIEKQRPEIYLDFNAVAKGYGIDKIGGCLDAWGVDNYLVELGGELLAKGTNLDKESAWRVGVEEIVSDPTDRSYSKVVKLKDAGMASSGNYRKFRIDSLTGKKFVHTINPKTGMAEASDVTSATVIAETCAIADAYATAFMAMGIERAKKLLDEETDLHAYLTWIDSEGNSKVYMTSGFKVLLAE